MITRDIEDRVKTTIPEIRYFEIDMLNSKYVIEIKNGKKIIVKRGKKTVSYTHLTLPTICSV